MRVSVSALLSALLIGSLLAAVSACDAENSCDSCKATEVAKKAIDNRFKIETFLYNKKCEEWRGLTFKVAAFKFSGKAKCRSLSNQPFPGAEGGQCTFKEDLDLTIDEDIAVEATTPAIDSMAREGQLECEPNGTMVFNRGNVQYMYLDSLFEPVPYLPISWPKNAPLIVGFEVILQSTLERTDNHWCHDVDSAFLMFYDVVDGSGNSVLSSWN